MSTQDPKDIARRYYDEIINGANLATIDELMDEDFVFSLPTHPEPFHGPEGFKEFITMFHGAIPDVHLTVEHLLAEGDYVVGHWTGSGTHTGGPLPTVMGNLPPGGRHFRIDGMTWLKIVNGKIKESLANEDTVGLLTQLGVLPAREPSAPPSSSERDLASVERYFGELLNHGRLEVIDELVAPEFVLRIPTLPEPVRGPEGLKRFVAALRTGFPDLRFTVQRRLSDGNKVAARWFIEGTHQGPFLGIPPTNNRVRDQGIDIFVFREDGRLAELWVNEDDLGLLRQLGALPPAATPEQGRAPMSGTTAHDIARNKALTRQLFDRAWNENDMALLDAMVTPDGIDHSPFRDDALRGPENFKHVVGMFRAALEELHLTIEDEIAEEDRVVHRWKLRGRHTGELFGAPPTGKEVSMSGMTIVRMENGKVVERWSNMDQLGLLQQLGAIP